VVQNLSAELAHAKAVSATFQSHGSDAGGDGGGGGDGDGGGGGGLGDGGDGDGGGGDGESDGGDGEGGGGKGGSGASGQSYSLPSGAAYLSVHSLQPQQCPRRVPQLSSHPLSLHVFVWNGGPSSSTAPLLVQDSASVHPSCQWHLISQPTPFHFL